MYSVTVREARREKSVSELKSRGRRGRAELTLEAARENLFLTFPRFWQLLAVLGL